MTRKVTIATGALLLAGLLWSCSSNTTQQGAGTPSTTDTQGTAGAGPAVQFTALDIDGKTRASSEWIGKQPVVINFWGTWCPPCRQEIPDLVKLYDEYKGRGVEMVSLAVKDEPAAVRSYATEARMNWIHLMGDDPIYQVFGGVRGVPTTIFYDQTGKEVKRFVGAQSYQTFKQAFEAISAS